MISKFSIGNLGLISTFCGISALAMMVNFKKSEKEKHARQPFCREPVKLLRNHQGANHVLGTPITLGQIKNETFYNEKPNPTYMFPASGPNGQGVFSIRTECETHEGKRHCLVRRCDLILEETNQLDPEQYKDKALVIYDRNRHGPLKYETKNQ